MIEQFFKFCVVGGSGVFVDFGVTAMLAILTLPLESGFMLFTERTNLTLICPKK